MGTLSIHEFLRGACVPYVVVPHPPAFTAQQGTAATQVRGRDWAKVVVCFVDGEPIEALLPASFIVNLEWLRELTGGRAVRVATDEDLRQLSPDYEPGAMPPFGPLHGHTVFVDVTLAAESELAFNAGTRPEAITMRWADFARSVRPIVGKFGEHQLDRIGFRLSYRE